MGVRAVIGFLGHFCIAQALSPSDTRTAADFEVSLRVATSLDANAATTLGTDFTLEVNGMWMPYARLCRSAAAGVVVEAKQSVTGWPTRLRLRQHNLTAEEAYSIDAWGLQLITLTVVLENILVTVLESCEGPQCEYTDNSVYWLDNQSPKTYAIPPVTTTVTTTSWIPVQVTLQVRTSTLDGAGTALGLTFAFEHAGLWDDESVLCTAADLGETVSRTANLVTWPTRLRLRSIPDHQGGYDAYSYHNITAVLASGNWPASVTVLESCVSVGCDWSASSDHWLLSSSDYEIFDVPPLPTSTTTTATLPAGLEIVIVGSMSLPGTFATYRSVADYCPSLEAALASTLGLHPSAVTLACGFGAGRRLRETLPALAATFGIVAPSGAADALLGQVEDLQDGESPVFKQFHDDFAFEVSASLGETVEVSPPSLSVGVEVATKTSTTTSTTTATTTTTTATTTTTTATTTSTSNTHTSTTTSTSTSTISSTTSSSSTYTLTSTTLTTTSLTSATATATSTTSTTTVTNTTTTWTTTTSFTTVTSTPTGNITDETTTTVDLMPPMLDKEQQGIMAASGGVGVAVFGCCSFLMLCSGGGSAGQAFRNYRRRVRKVLCEIHDDFHEIMPGWIESGISTGELPLAAERSGWSQAEGAGASGGDQQVKATMCPACDTCAGPLVNQGSGLWWCSECSRGVQLTIF